MRFTRISVLLGSALFLAVAVLARPMLHDPGGDRTFFAVAKVIDLDRQAEAFTASIEAFSVLDVVVQPLPGAEIGHRVADLRGDGRDLTKRLDAIVQGGRVKSARSLTVSPASRYSARV